MTSAYSTGIGRAAVSGNHQPRCDGITAWPRQPEWTVEPGALWVSSSCSFCC